MSALSDAVHEDLASRGIDLGLAAVEKILADEGVTAVASRGVPVRLRVRRVAVTGTRHFRKVPACGDLASEPGNFVANATMASVPIDLDWSPQNGLNGIGSEANLRGKSSVLHFAMWALTGRSHLQPDVLSWVRTVDAEFHLDDVPIYVQIAMSDGEPIGKVEQGVRRGRSIIGRFSGHSDFEHLMGSVMLDRLRLDVIPVFSNGVQIEHSWPTYAGALAVYADRLDPIVGNVQDLKIRILQMFTGTGWATVGAQVANALNARRHEREKVNEKRSTTRSVPEMTLAAAEDRLELAKTALEQFDSSEPDVAAVLSLASSAAERAQKSHGISVQLMSASTAASEVRAQLRAEELRRRALAEDAVARRLFNGLTPSACPRCSTKVTAKRYAAEATEHECSVCASHLELDALEEPNIAGTAIEDAANDEEEEETDESVDPLDALREAAADADLAVEALNQAYLLAEQRRFEAEAAMEKGRGTLESARARLSAELDFARAEGARDGLRQTLVVEPEPTGSDSTLTVLRSADKLVKAWLKNDQDPLLETVSKDIAELAQRFGASNITAVSLKGSGNMEVFKGGAKSGYSGLTSGEKLRVKIASAIALIRLGHEYGVGRHPGLLFIDSPAAEEVPEADLKVMLEAMTSVAQDTDLQIVVATTHGPMLSNVMPPQNLLVAAGDDYVW